MSKPMPMESTYESSVERFDGSSCGWLRDGSVYCSWCEYCRYKK